MKTKADLGTDTVTKVVGGMKELTKITKEEHPKSRRDCHWVKCHWQSGQVCKEDTGCRRKGTIGDPSCDFYETTNICGMEVNRL